VLLERLAGTMLEGRELRRAGSASVPGRRPKCLRLEVVSELGPPSSGAVPNADRLDLRARIHSVALHGPKTESYEPYPFRPTGFYGLIAFVGFESLPGEMRRHPR
jgi:hypothetical protein